MVKISILVLKIILTSWRPLKAVRGWPGIGKKVTHSCLSRDFPLNQG